MFTFFYFTAFLGAGKYVANISKVDCWSNFWLAWGGNASPTSCCFTPQWIPFVSLRSSFSSGQINGNVSVPHSPSLFLSLWALCCLLFSLVYSPERGLCNNNSRHDKREHMQPYRPYTLQRITQLSLTHCLTGWRNRGCVPWPAWEEWSEGWMCVCVCDCIFVRGCGGWGVSAESQAERKRNGGGGKGGGGRALMPTAIVP